METCSPCILHFSLSAGCDVMMTTPNLSAWHYLLLFILSILPARHVSSSKWPSRVEWVPPHQLLDEAIPGAVEGRPTLRLAEACEENHVAPPRLGNMYAAEEVGYSESETETTTGQVSHSIKLLKWSRPYDSDTSHGKAGQHTRSS